MKMFFISLIIISLLLSCIQKNVVNNEIIINNNDNILSNNTQFVPNIIIGGYDTGERLTTETINDTESFLIIIDEDRSLNFTGIGLLPNITSISIVLVETVIDFSPLTSLPVLQHIELGGRGLKEVPDLSGIPTLVHLELDSGMLTSLNGIEKIKSLKQLEIKSNRIPLTDIFALRYMRNLKTLLFFNGFYNIDFSILAYLPELEELEFSGCREMDLKGISQLKSLIKLSLSSYFSIDERSVFKNIEDIGKLYSLKELYLDDYITSVEFLAGNINLESLTLIADKEREDYWTVDLPLDIKPLKNLVNLKYLVIRGFDIENMNVLNELPNIKILETNKYNDH